MRSRRDDASSATQEQVSGSNLLEETQALLWTQRAHERDHAMTRPRHRRSWELSEGTEKRTAGRVGSASELNWLNRINRFDRLGRVFAFRRVCLSEIYFSLV